MHVALPVQILMLISCSLAIQHLCINRLHTIDVALYCTYYTELHNIIKQTMGHDHYYYRVNAMILVLDNDGFSINGTYICHDIRHES